MRRTRILVATLVAMAASIVVYGAEPIVHVQAGAVRGQQMDDGSTLFRGIPFAAPPTGANRWRAPQPLEPWAGVRDATRRAAPCMQSSFGWNERDAASSSEDCLYLDVHTPKLDAAAKLPVIVWIHGGANRAGSAGDYAASTMVQSGVVLVAIQYRLDVFGFLSLPELTKESPTRSSGNYALLDQLAALGWVHDNIAAFGGDANQVTLFGQSAGAQDVGLLMLSPRSKGLFVRAIEESGTAGFGLPPRSLQQNEELGADFLRLAGARSVAELRGSPAQALLAASLKLDPPQIEDDSFIWLQSIVDGYVLPDTPERILRSGKQQPVPLMLGTNATEFPLYKGGSNARHAVEVAFGKNSAEALRVYGIAHDKPVSESLATRIAADIMFRCPAAFVAEAHERAGNSVFQYEFAVTPVNGGTPIHSSELPYVFGGLVLPKNAEVKLQNYWVRFAKTADPNPSGEVQWPRFGLSRSYVEFSDTGLTAKQQLGGSICNLRSAP
ncbi:MAG TPA: carboxylesterase family protein [Steroidobacteraceae bacterium]|nr:carboxylesterase family protein [Steroidobacteraceae bacterium]